VATPYICAVQERWVLAVTLVTRYAKQMALFRAASRNAPPTDSGIVFTTAPAPDDPEAQREESTSLGSGVLSAPDAGATEANIDREEHAANILCLQRSLTVGGLVWPVFTVLDYSVSRHMSAISFTNFLLLRIAGWFFIVAGLLRLHHVRPLSKRMLLGLETFIYAQASALVAIMCVWSGGFKSPYAAGIPLIMVCRNAFVAQNWKQALFANSACGLMYPLVLLASTLFSPAIVLQFADPVALVHVSGHLLFIASTVAFSVIGGHARWSLRRQVFQARCLGRYRIIQKLGAGGMGEVWTAQHRGLKRFVAIKVLRSDGRRDLRAVRRFEREAHALSQLSHPNTVRIFDYGVTPDGLCYYAMELLHGKNLGQLVAEQGPLPPERAIRLLLQASRALGEAHAFGIVHRDVKPENLFVMSAGDENDILKVLDFGIAKLLIDRPDNTVTAANWIGGTPSYMSPEAAAGLVVSPRSDVYALGATLYFALTGRPPFEGSSVGAILQAHIKTIPLSPSVHLDRSLPAELDAIVLRCLEKSPADRYANASELADALANLRIHPQQSAALSV